MGLLAPWFLAGLVALGLPVWLHLLRRRHSPPREFSSLMLFERRTESAVRQRRLRYWLLLALRCLVLAALALAFTRPYRETAAAGAAGGRLVVLAVDESFSMGQGDRMARARSGALARLGRLGPGERLQVIAFAAGVRLLNEPARDPAEARAALQSLAATDSRSSYAALVRALGTIAAAARGPVEAHVFTDMQRSALPESFRDLLLPPGVHLELHAAAEGPVDNWTVEAVSAPACVYGPHPVRVQATLAGLSRQTARRRASLIIGGRIIETKEADVPAGGRTAVEFLARELRQGVNRAEVRLEPADAFPADDRRLFAIERADPRPVLFVHQARERRARLYFRTALEASAQGAFRLEEVAVEQTAGLKPAHYAFVVLSDPGWLPGSFAAALRAYAEGGGAVWITLGPSAIASQRAPLLDRPVTANGDLRASYQTVWELDAAHPALERTGRWEGVKFYRAARLESGEGRVLARLADRTPLLLEEPLGAGRVLVFASTLDNLSNDFPLHPSFVPFVERTSAYLGRIEDKIASLTVDAHLSLRAANERGTAVEVTGPDGERVLSLQEATTAESLLLKRAGYYEVHRGNGRHQTLAVNPDPRESDLDIIPAETLALWRNSGRQEQGTEEAGAPERARRGLWQAVLLLALAAAAAESLAANRHLFREDHRV